jgi:hypothetical protein
LHQGEDLHYAPEDDEDMEELEVLEGRKGEEDSEDEDDEEEGEDWGAADVATAVKKVSAFHE